MGFYFVSHVKPFNGHRMPCQKASSDSLHEELVEHSARAAFWNLVSVFMDPPGNLCERLPFKINEAMLDIGVRQPYMHAVANVEV